MNRRRLPGAGVLVLLTLVSAPLSSATEPDPLTDLERAAVELAMVYLADGPQAWLHRLASDSPFASLPVELASRELESRAGPPQGSRWTLQTLAREQRARLAIFTVEFPSGIDEILVMELVKEGEDFRLFGLTSLAESRSGGSKVSSISGPTPKSPSWPIALVILPLMLVLRSEKMGKLLALTFASTLVLGLACRLGPEGPPEEITVSEDRPSGLERLDQLVDLRRQLTAGEGPQGEGGEKASSEVARLWLAQWHLAHNDSHKAQILLAEIPSSSRRPLAGLLGARLAVLQSQEVDTVLAFEKIFAVLPDFDGLHLEAAQSLELMGFEERSLETLGHLGEIGSRNAFAYYAMARNAVVEGDRVGALKHLKNAWDLEPIERSAFLSDPVLVSLSDSPQVTRWLLLDEPDEPRPILHGTGTRPIFIPERATSRLNGSHLRIKIDTSEIAIPGGHELAPPQTEQSDPLTIRRHNESEALKRLDVLRSAGADALAQPGLRRDLEAATGALARRFRWTDLEELTRGESRENQPLPSWWIQLRAHSLRQLDRGAEAQALLVDLARDDLSRGRRNPSTYYQLAEHLASDGHFDLAVRLIERANASLPFESNDIRIRRLLLDRRLAADFATLETDNFRLHYPRDTSLYIAEQMGELLEKERLRLGAWIPLSEGLERVDVDLVAWREFRALYSGMLGLFDGRVRVPLAEVRQVEHPMVIALISHEIAHALIDQASNGRAPHWFHEGLAQHVQILQARLNPIPGYRLTNRLLAFPLIEAVLGSYAHPELVTIAYDEAAWTVHYLELKHGKETIPELIRLFADGMDTDAALEAVFGWSQPEFHRNLDRWWQEEAPELWTPPENPYG